jgi:hypothetical protein
VKLLAVPEGCGVRLVRLPLGIPGEADHHSGVIPITIPG